MVLLITILLTQAVNAHLARQGHLKVDRFLAEGKDKQVSKKASFKENISITKS